MWAIDFFFNFHCAIAEVFWSHRPTGLLRVFLQRSPCARAATSTSWTASSSRCWTATGTASAWSAATVRRSWRRSASAEATASTARRISSSKKLKHHISDPLPHPAVRWIPNKTVLSPKEIRDQMRSVSAGDSTHAGGEESAGLRLPPPLFRLHRVQKAAGDRWRVLPDGGQQTGVQDGLRDRQTERCGSVLLRVLRPSLACACHIFWYMFTVIHLTWQWGHT